MRSIIPWHRCYFITELDEIVPGAGEELEFLTEEGFGVLELEDVENDQDDNWGEGIHSLVVQLRAKGIKSKEIIIINL